MHANIEKEFIRQESHYDCAIACLRTLTGRSYAEICGHLGYDPRWTGSVGGNFAVADVELPAVLLECGYAASYWLTTLSAAQLFASDDATVVHRRMFFPPRELLYKWGSGKWGILSVAYDDPGADPDVLLAHNVVWAGDRAYDPNKGVFWDIDETLSRTVFSAVFIEGSLRRRDDDDDDKKTQKRATV